MDRLPAELIIRIFRYLDVIDLVHVQLISSRYLLLARDDAIWKEECWTHSRTEARRRRQHQLDIQDARLAELRFALTALPGSEGNVTATTTATTTSIERIRKKERYRARVNWDPGYPDEKLDFYHEYISRHAPVRVDWLHLPSTNQDEAREATGVAVLNTSTSRHAVVPLDDGSICIYDISARSTFNARGGGNKLLAQSRPGLLSGQPPSETAKSHAIMTETGAVECLFIDRPSQTGYFAVGCQLHHIDLSTLQNISTKSYPFPITALSQSTPLTIGTNHTIHLHDPRDPILPTYSTTSGIQLIAGRPSHASLPQPGPLSILPIPLSNSLCVAGRFTSLLTYDIRHFPRLISTTFSGARIASLSLLPYPYIPRDMDLLRNPYVSLADYQSVKSRRSGSTIFAAGEYKGKGSLELYPTHPREGEEVGYRNRQTASASKLLAVASHGGKVVISDGDGNLRWFERDGSSLIRSWNLADSITRPDVRVEDDENGIWERSRGDIVQKIVNLSGEHSSSIEVAGRRDIGEEELLLWTGEGKLGVLGFGSSNPVDGVEGSDEVSAVERATEDAERQFGRAMRRALRRNAEEVRFVRGLGLGLG